MKTERERFFSKIQDYEKGLDHCQLWIGSKNPEGYGRFSLNGRPYPAHRFIYEKTFGEIPDKFVIDHLCRTPSCVNPYHLEAVPHGENIRRGDIVNRKKTHCPKGHPYSGDNLYRYPDGRRDCRTCADDARKKYEAKKRGTI